MVAAVVALVLLPFVVAAGRVAGRHAPAPDGDTALIELRVRDVGGHTPLVGSYNRFGFNQPGPLLFYVFAVPYRLLGSQYSGIQIGALLVNAAAVVLVLLVAYRRARLIGLLGGAVVLTLVIHGLGAAGIASPWEPYVVVLPLIALAVAVTDVLCGGRRSLVSAVVLGSVIAGAYTAVAGVAVLLVLIAFVGVAVRWWRDRGDGPVWRAPFLIALAIGIVLWAPAILDVAGGRPNNVTRTVAYLRSGRAVAGLRDGYAMVALQLDHHVRWFRGSIPLRAFEPFVDTAAVSLVPIALVALLAAALVEVWRRARPGLTFSAIAAAMVFAFVIVDSRLSGGLYIWLAIPSRAAGAVTWLALGAAAWLAVRPALSKRARAVAAAVVAAVALGGSAAAIWRAAQGPVTAPREADAVASLAARAAATVRALGGPVTVHSDVANNIFLGSRFGREQLTLALVRRGIPVVVSDTTDDRVRYGDWRVGGDRAVADVRIVASPAGYVAPPGSRIVATADPLTPAERALRNRYTPKAGESGPDALRQVADRARRDAAFRRDLAVLQSLPNVPPLAVIVTPLPSAR